MLAVMHRQPVESSAVRSVGYDKARRVLEVEVEGGAVYQYLGVPARDYFGLLEGPLWWTEGGQQFLVFSDMPANVVYKWTPDRQLSVFLDGVKDPGNVGTIIRSAHALCDGPVIIGPRCADPYGPKAVRASMGSIFARPPARARAAEFPGT